MSSSSSCGSRRGPAGRSTTHCASPSPRFPSCERTATSSGCAGLGACGRSTPSSRAGSHVPTRRGGEPPSTRGAPATTRRCSRCWTGARRPPSSGPTPVPEAIELCQELQEQVRSSPVALASVHHALASLHAMTGDVDAGPATRRRRRRDPRRARRPACGGVAAGGARRDAGRPRAGRGGSGCARATSGSRRWARRRCSPRRRRCSRRSSTRRAGMTRPRDLCRLSEGAAAANDLSAQVTWRGVCAKAARGAGPHARRRGARTGGGAPGRADRLPRDPRRRAARPGVGPPRGQRRRRGRRSDAARRSSSTSARATRSRRRAPARCSGGIAAFSITGCPHQMTRWLPFAFSLIIATATAKASPG